MKTDPEIPGPDWHNPDNLPSPGEGQRFLVKGEEKESGDEFWAETTKGARYWKETHSSGTPDSDTTYRTLRPTPEAGATRETPETDGLIDRCYAVREEIRDHATPAIILHQFVKHELATVERERDEARENNDRNLELLTEQRKKIDALRLDLTASRAEAEGLRRERDDATKAMWSFKNAMDKAANERDDLRAQLTAERDMLNAAERRAESKHGSWMSELKRVGELETQLTAAQTALAPTREDTERLDWIASYGWAGLRDALAAHPSGVFDIRAAIDAALALLGKGEA